MPPAARLKLDASKRSDDAIQFEQDLRRKIVSQDEAIAAIVDIFQVFKSGLCVQGRPIGNFLFLGPTGTGKTRIAESVSEVLYGTSKAMIKIDCAEFQHSHEIAKLTGCFIPGTQVLMADGTKKSIEDILIGDLVITEKGRRRKVNFVHKYDYAGDMVKLTISGHKTSPIIVTPNHEIRAIRINNPTGRVRDPKSQYKSEKLEWVPAGKLQKHDIVVYPRFKPDGPYLGSVDLFKYAEKFGKSLHCDDKFVWFYSDRKTPRYIEMNSVFMRIAGYYVADGGNSKTGKNVLFTMGTKTKRSAIQDLLKILPETFGGDVKVEKRPNAEKLFLFNRIISELLGDLFGEKHDDKHLPDWFLNLPDELLWNFLDAAIMGDGGRSVRRRIDYSTTSVKLSSQIVAILSRLGVISQTQIGQSKNPKWKTRYRIYISGDQIDKIVSNLNLVSNDLDLYNPGNNGIQRQGHVDCDYIYYRITDTEKIKYEGNVYDLAVDEDESYVTNMAVHNSPPGYLGHRETHPVITQEKLSAYHTEKTKISFLLFDEIEKASDALWQLLLGILDKATLTLGDNRCVDLSNTMIFLTSNLGGRAITELMTGSLGFSTNADQDKKFDNKVDRTAVQHAKKKFAPEFMNRIDKTVVFHPLREQELVQILDIELSRVQERIFSADEARFSLTVKKSAKEFLLDEGTDLTYGARHLKRAIEKFVVQPLANLVSSHQIGIGDLVVVDYNHGDASLDFCKLDNLVI